MRSSPATAAASSCHRVHHEWRHYIALVQRKPRALRDGAPSHTMAQPLR